MVRILSPYFVLAALAAATYASPTKRTTIAQIESDIANMQTQVTKLDKVINDFPTTGGTVAQLSAIHKAAGTLITTFNNACTDAQSLTPYPVSESDGQQILADGQAFEPVILDALSAIVEKKAALTGIPLDGVSDIILNDLQNLNASTFDFGAAMIAAVPADLQQLIAGVAGSIGSGYATAIAAYT